MLGLEAGGNTMNHTMEHLKIKFIFIFDKINSIDHPVEITHMT